MKIVLDLINEPKVDDVILFTKDGFKCISKQELFATLEKELVEVRDDIKKDRLAMEKLKVDLNAKLKEYHDILQLISKGE